MEERKKAVVVETRRPTVRAEAPVVRSLTAPARKVSPCAYQTQEEIEKYYRAAEAGAVAVVRQTQHHMLVYYVTDVEGTGRGRTYIRNHGSFYMKSGKNCYHPKGQTTLVVPTPEVMQWAAEHPRGELDWWTFPPERAGIFPGS